MAAANAPRAADRRVRRPAVRTRWLPQMDSRTIQKLDSRPRLPDFARSLRILTLPLGVNWITSRPNTCDGVSLSTPAKRAREGFRGMRFAHWTSEDKGGFHQFFCDRPQYYYLVT